VNGYEFNKSSIKNNIVNNAIIYGKNGVGKSNLALAIFDIIGHLTESYKIEGFYDNYQNAYSNAKTANFYYEFLIDSKVIVYEYRKSDYKKIVYESFKIDNEELAFFDRTDSTNATIRFKGAETLKTAIENPELSILKYVKNNTVLEQNETNATFLSFLSFVEKMLYFRSLQEGNMFFGKENSGKNILRDIAEKGNTQDFEKILNQAGVKCKLSDIKFETGERTIAFNLNGKLMPFTQVASTGTMSLALFYFWYQNIKENISVSFLFIDEFDAFYHHSLSNLIVEKLKETGAQFILTTHNVSIMTNDLLRPDCYFTMTEKKIQSFSKSTQKELREAHNIEKMYKAGAFDVK
jgi:AAA15 family ATPase/GTPase